MQISPAALLLALLFWGSVFFPAAARGEASPTTIPLGFYLVECGDFDPKSRSFHADFWLWAQVPAGMEGWLGSLAFTNGIDVEAGNPVGEPVGGRVWSGVNVSGKFREDWNPANFPFDRRRLRIQIEEASMDASRLLFAADRQNSTAGEAVLPEGWRVTGFSIEAGLRKTGTNYGNPAKPPGAGSEHAALSVLIGIERESTAVFWKLAAIPYIAAALAFLSFFVVFDSYLMVGRFSLLVGSVFAASVSMRGLNSELGTSDVFTLMDWIHIATLVFVLAGILAALASREMFQRLVPERKILLWNAAAAFAALAAYAALNIGLVVSALRS